MKTSAIFLALTMSLSIFSQSPALAQGTDYEAGLTHYKNKNYNAAIKSFERELEKGEAKPEVYTYLGHSHFAVGDKSRAIKRYEEMANKFKGQPAEQKARDFIKRLDPTGRYSKPVATSILQRIQTIPPASGHPPVDGSTVAIVRTQISRLPAYIQKILEQSGTTIYVGTNATDKWPDDWRKSKPGMETISQSQEGGRTVGSDIYIWERPTENGTQKLDDKFDNDDIEEAVMFEVGHVVSRGLGNIPTELGFKEKYESESKLLDNTKKSRYRFFLQEDGKGEEELAASCIAHILANPNGKYYKEFARCEEWVRQRLEAARTGRASLLVSLGPSDKKKTGKETDKTKGIQTATAKAAEKEKADKEKAEKDKKTKPDFIPDEDKVPYWTDLGSKHRVKGLVNGRPTTMMLDTGAYKVVIGWEVLQALGIKPPEGKATGISGGAGGSFEHWDMPVEIQIGKIRRTVTANIVKNEPEILIGQPFLKGMTYRIDNRGGYLHFVKTGSGSKPTMAVDAIEVPYRMVNGNLMVQAKINDTQLEMNFDTGAPTTVLDFDDAMRIGLLFKSPNSVASIGGIGGGSQQAYEYELKSIELGSKRKTGFTIHVMNIGHSVLGQDFFGTSQFIVDSDKQVIRFSRR